MEQITTFRASRLEKALALAGLAICVVVVILVWAGIGANQPMWPLPGLYFVEVILLAAINAILWAWDAPLREMVNLAAAGVYSVFVVVGLLSIGLLFLPNVLIFAALAVLAGIRMKGNAWRELALYLAAAAVQTILMFLAT